jgi:peptide/nickel transport system ATP-binding protein
LADRRPLELSGGQRQRVALARALALRPDLLVLDEAFSALDRRSQDELGELLRRLQAERGLTCLLISHDQALVDEWADRACYMVAGRIASPGTEAWERRSA